MQSLKPEPQSAEKISLVSVTRKDSDAIADIRKEIITITKETSLESIIKEEMKSQDPDAGTASKEAAKDTLAPFDSDNGLTKRRLSSIPDFSKYEAKGDQKANKQTSVANLKKEIRMVRLYLDILVGVWGRSGGGSREGR